jgi:hypothetical protein
VNAESSFERKHLIAQNIANGSTRIEKPHPAVSIFNFHYSRPPDSVRLNWELNKAIGLNETGFDGSADSTYRVQAWDFILAGGAVYNNLDYSFTVEHPDGTNVPDGKTPGGGSPALRRQLKVLKDFIHGYNFIAMSPQESVISSGVPKAPQLEFLPTRDETMRSTFTMGSQDSATTARRRRPNRGLSMRSLPKSNRQRCSAYCHRAPMRLGGSTQRLAARKRPRNSKAPVNRVPSPRLPIGKTSRFEYDECSWFRCETRKRAGKLPFSGEEGCGGSDAVAQRHGVVTSPVVRTSPAAASGRGFPSLSKEGSFKVEFRDRN